MNSLNYSGTAQKIINGFPLKPVFGQSHRVRTTAFQGLTKAEINRVERMAITRGWTWMLQSIYGVAFVFEDLKRMKVDGKTVVVRPLQPGERRRKTDVWRGPLPYNVKTARWYRVTQKGKK